MTDAGNEEKSGKPRGINPLSQGLKNDAERVSIEPDLFPDHAPAKGTVNRRPWKRNVFLLFFLVGLFVPVGSHVKGEGMVINETRALVGVVVPGILKEVFKHEGDSVGKDEIIVTLKNNDLERELERTRFRSEALKIEQATLFARGELSEKKFSRASMLFENRVISREDLEQVGLSRQEIENEQKKIAQEIVLVDEAIATLEETLSSLQVKSPIDGVLLTELSPRIGNYFKEGEELFLIGNPRGLLIETYVNEKSVAQLQTNGDALVRFPGLPDIEAAGTIERIATEAREKIENVFKIRTVVSVLIRLDEIPRGLKIGMRAHAKLAQRNTSLLMRICELLVSLFTKNRNYVTGGYASLQHL